MTTPLHYPNKGLAMRFQRRSAVLRTEPVARLGLTAAAAIALVGCSMTPQERAQQAAREAASDEDRAFRDCIDEVVGAFSAASIEVVRECRAHAKARGQ